MNGRRQTVRTLARLALRRDAVMIGVTLAFIWLMSFYSARAVRDLYADRASLVASNTAGNASAGVVAMYGRVHDLASVGGLGANKIAMIDMVALAFLVTAIVRRHTRADEEQGRLELLGATPRVRSSALGAAVLVAVVTSVVCGLVTDVCLQLGGWPARGSMMLGLAQAGVGLSFTGIAAIAMQLSANARSCSMWAYGAVALAFLLRMIGDVEWNTPLAFLSWLSPLGWAQQVRPYDGDRGWVLVLPLVFCVLGVVLAARLNAGRDLAGGLLATRPGAAHSRIGSVFGLGWRLQRIPLVGWLVIYLLFGALSGGISGSMSGFVNSSDEHLLQAMGGAGHLSDLYLTLVNAFAAFGAAAYGVSSVLQLRTEETQGRLEPVLAAPVGRWRFAWSHLWIALAGPVLLQAALGAASASVHGLAGGSSGWWREFTPSLVALPGIWLMVALALAAIGWVPRLDWLGWALLGWVVVLQEVGGLVGFPHWLMQVSPFPHLPQLPVSPMDWAPVLWLTALSALVVALSLVGYRRRDMPVG